ncbi:MAG TPA: alpha-L-arabinofuranosidase C-terminal domain-containing protein [Phycisphaerae bacterium]|nr:alpha-L-arabinofuranosidase C-terminal domain-containing protein [Phycisphaerae bacterium]
METTLITMHTRFGIAPVDERIFGGFLEHIGRAVYGGVFDPAGAHADESGFRRDVCDALGRLGMTAMRYPGGNFASGYHWLDGVGPADRRPTVRDLSWQSVETNRFGTDEFLALCRRMAWTGMLTVNLGTGTPEEARNWAEYCNCPAGTRYADLRAANGHPDPHAVKLWCLGNEMDGPWQLGHVPADVYAVRAQQAAKMIKDVDRTVELVVCGSCGTTMPTYMEWDRVALEAMGDLADYLSIHRYVGNRNDDTADYLAVTGSIDRQIEQADAVCRYVQARRRSAKRAYVCFDEWNVWYKNHQTDGAGQVAPPLLEEVYNLEDALVVAGFLHSFLRHADVLKIANLAQIVNVIAPLITRGDELLIQPTFHAFEMISARRRGVSLRLAVEGPAYESPSYGPTPILDAAAVLDGDRLNVFATNRSLDEDAEVEIDVADRDVTSLESAEILTGPDPKAANSFDRPDAVAPAAFDDVAIKNGKARVKLPPLATAAMTFHLR